MAIGSIRSWPNVWDDEEEDGAENEIASTDDDSGEAGAENASMSSTDDDGGEDGTVKVKTSGDDDGAEKVMASSDDGWLSTTEGRGLNLSGEEEDGLDDCCGLKGLSLLKKFLIPSRRVPCPCDAETRERTTTDRSHSLILSTLRHHPPDYYQSIIKVD